MVLSGQLYYTYFSPIMSATFYDAIMCQTDSLVNVKVLTAIGLALYILGLAHWAALMPDATTDLMRIDDWRYAHYYYSVWQQALTEGVFPYRVQPLLQPTDHFWAIPEMICSPQLLLLPFLSLRDFALANIWIQYSIGFWGSICLVRYFRWSAMVWVAFWLLFNFNGFIVAHIAVGHFWVGSYFLLPFFVELVCRLTMTSNVINGRVSLGLAAVLAAIYLQGAFHIYIWCVWLLIFLACFNRSIWREVARAIGWGALLLAFRILPTLVTFYDQTRFHFVGGFPTLSHLWEGLVNVRGFDYPATATYFGHLGWWELDMYIDISGLGFLLVFGLLLQLPTYRNRKDELFERLCLPLLCLATMSLSYVYGIVAKLPVPLLHSERVSSRFFSVALVFWIAISATRCQGYLDGVRSFNRPLVAMTMCCWVVVLGLSLMHHSFIWRINNIAVYYPDAPVSTLYRIVSSPDLHYATAVWLGWGVSVVAALRCSVVWWREGQYR